MKYYIELGEVPFMKDHRFLFDIALTTLGTAILFSILMGFFYPFISKGHYPMDLETNLAFLWFFLFSFFPLLFIAPIHYLSLKIGEWVGPLLVTIVATILVTFINIDWVLFELFSPFLLVTPVFCLLSKFARFLIIRFDG
ncbi:hypothetical protein [Alkalicoccobacillus murimartini]|uniref:Apolipoprotein N-acyltransferase n=1 Tax=Alkalicoccobacillus murimartini TaxID=171685 RepID=A0ABT9YC16_9BACI|nr:hypothetical protein [Alkalicoccobacillus murimartini]MDQ0205390.1 apolipoprotein N-acyltransferase [Alkalicoccobacillus murimartini]